MRENIDWWEKELWHYLDTGDGDTCPLHDNCDTRKNGHWCISDQKEFVGDMSYLINSDEINPRRGRILSMLKSCRIFKQIE